MATVQFTPHTHLGVGGISPISWTQQAVLSSEQWSHFPEVTELGGSRNLSSEGSPPLPTLAHLGL